jgi:hypothetical protein
MIKLLLLIERRIYLPWSSSQTISGYFYAQILILWRHSENGLSIK